MLIRPFKLTALYAALENCAMASASIVDGFIELDILTDDGDGDRRSSRFDYLINDDTIRIWILFL